MLRRTLEPRHADAGETRDHNVVCLVVAGEGRSHIGEETFEWSQHDVFTIPHWTFARHEARGGDADLFMVTDKSAFERLDLVREEMK